MFNIDSIVANGIIAWITIIIVGIIKDFNVFNKIDKPLRRPLYLIIDCILASGLSALYFVVAKLSFTTFIGFAVQSLSITLSLYATYENTKLKDLVAIAKERLVKVIGKNVIEKQAQQIVENQNKTTDQQ